MVESKIDWKSALQHLREPAKITVPFRFAPMVADDSESVAAHAALDKIVNDAMRAQMQYEEDTIRQFMQDTGLTVDECIIIVRDGVKYIARKSDFEI